jgi:capsule polysaccharide export protein KpsE/RkpR
VIAVWERRRWLAKFIGWALLISIGLTLLAFLVPNKYTSTAELMPPDAKIFSSPQVLNLTGMSLLSNPENLLNQTSPGDVIVDVLKSRTVQDDIMNRFDLRRIYHCKLEVCARKALTDATKVTIDKDSGTISIAVEDRDRYLAQKIAQAYIEELNSLASGLSTSSARRERIFLEQRLKSIKADLDASSLALSQFASKNATFDPGKQGEATVEATSKLQADLIAAESELSGLSAVYSDDNVRVRALRARIAVLRDQLRKMSGELPNQGGNAVPEANEILPSVRQLPILGYTYSNLFRQVNIDESLYETLTKQYGMARIEEAKEIPLIKVLDAPNVPEQKSGPHRSLLFICSFLFLMVVGIGWVIASRLWEVADDSSSIKRNGLAILQAVRGQGATVKVPGPLGSAGPPNSGTEAPDLGTC